MINAAACRVSAKCGKLLSGLSSCEGEEECGRALLALNYCVGSIACPSTAQTFMAALQQQLPEHDVDIATAALSDCAESFLRGGAQSS